MTRAQLASSIVDSIGADVAVMREPGRGWPSLIDIRLSDGVQPVFLHVSKASPHSREDYEWRFQNPGNRDPVRGDNQAIPILVGLDVIDGVEVLIAVDGRSRVGRVARFSILFNKRISREAARTGWSDQISSSGEAIFAMRPRLFPTLLDMLRSNAPLSAASVVNAANASGLVDEDSDIAAERARRTLSAYVRDVRFSRDVRAAYEHRCAMCRVGLGLTAGAHIMPVSAPGSPDRVWNGLALCHNHHSAFDKFHIWIDSDYSIRIRPEYQQTFAAEAESLRFLQQTLPTLWVPPQANQRPRRGMLEQRYQFYQGDYEWAPALSN